MIFFSKTCEGGFTPSVSHARQQEGGLSVLAQQTHTLAHTTCIFNITEHVELVFYSDETAQAPLC